MKIKLVFDDWRKWDGKRAASVYGTQRGLELSNGALHSGSTFDAEINLDAEESARVREAFAENIQPVFEVWPAADAAPETEPAAPEKIAGEKFSDVAAEWEKFYPRNERTCLGCYYGGIDGTFCHWDSREGRKINHADAAPRCTAWLPTDFRAKQIAPAPEAATPAEVAAGAELVVVLERLRDELAAIERQLPNMRNFIGENFLMLPEDERYPGFLRAKVCVAAAAVIEAYRKTAQIQIPLAAKPAADNRKPDSAAKRCETCEWYKSYAELNGYCRCAPPERGSKWQEPPTVSRDSLCKEWTAKA